MTVALMNQYIYTFPKYIRMQVLVSASNGVRYRVESNPTSSVDTMSHQDRETGIPGTEIVYRETDDDSTSSRQLLLIPSPTDNPDDPLVSPSRLLCARLSHSTD